MKTLKILLIIAFVMFSGSAVDAQNDENGPPKRAAVPIPVKGTMCISEGIQNMPVAGTPVTDPLTGKILVPQLFLLGTATLSGHATHIGNFIVGQSSMTGVSAHLDIGALLQGKIVFIADYYGSITAANGDQFDFVSSIVIDATHADPTDMARGGIITGTYTMTGGTGKFVNATGGGVLNGVIPCWDIEGTLEFSR
ncbi:MAG: hypothetical protein IQL11_16400 [Bacteroidales bacterium]|nr:hypothetical protein [Bacteroidales bacterium]